MTSSKKNAVNPVNSATSHKNVKYNSWEDILLKLIRPPRYLYQINQLGLSTFHMRGQIFNRTEIALPHQKIHIQISFFKPTKAKINTVIVYLHGNSSCKLEGVGLLRVLPQGFGLVTFDFLGCGRSLSEYVTLGKSQSEQIRTVVQYLQKSEGCRVVLWGRSMGASSALLYGGSCINVVDSPYVNMKRLLQQLAIRNKPKWLPQCLINCFFPCVYGKLQADIQKKANFDLNDLDVQKSVKQISQKKSIIFISGKSDQLINSQHCKDLYSVFKGKNKKLIQFQGTHNSERGIFLLQQVMNSIKDFIEQAKNKSSISTDQTSEAILPQ